MKRTALLMMMVLGLGIPTGRTDPAVRILKLTPGQGLTQAMRNAGCDLGWLDKVCTMNNILPSDFRNLPVGLEFSIPAGCAATPPREIALLSRQYMANDVPDRTIRTAYLAPLQKKFGAMETKVAAVENRIGAAERRIGILERPSSQTAAEARMKEPLQRRPATPPITALSLRTILHDAWLPLLLLAVLLLAIGASGGIVVYQRKFAAVPLSDNEVLVRVEEEKRRSAELEANLAKIEQELASLHARMKQAVWFEPAIEIPFGSKTHSFELQGVKKSPGGGYVGLYHCPLCSENNLHVYHLGAGEYKTDSLPQHLKKHSAKEPVAAVEST